MSGYVKLKVYGEEVGKVLTDGRATTEELLNLAGANWSPEGNCWTTSNFDTADTDYWYNAEDVEIVEVPQKELEIEILMKDKCTRREAINYLAKGAVIIPIEEWDKFVDQYDELYKNSEDLIENIKNGRLADHSYVYFNGKAYIIEYVL